MKPAAALAAVILLLAAGPAVAEGNNSLSYLHEQVPFFTLKLPKPGTVPAATPGSAPVIGPQTCVPDRNLRSNQVCGQSVRHPGD
jgi:hypothetical protein